MLRRRTTGRLLWVSIPSLSLCLFKQNKSSFGATLRGLQDRWLIFLRLEQLVLMSRSIPSYHPSTVAVSFVALIIHRSKVNWLLISISLAHPVYPGLEKDFEMDLCCWYPPLVVDHQSLLLHHTIFVCPLFFIPCSLVTLQFSLLDHPEWHGYFSTIFHCTSRIYAVYSLHPGWTDPQHPTAESYFWSWIATSAISECFSSVHVRLSWSFPSNGALECGMCRENQQ